MTFPLLELWFGSDDQDDEGTRSPAEHGRRASLRVVSRQDEDTVSGMVQESGVEDDNALVSRVRHGDVSAFITIFDLYSNRLCVFAYARTHDRTAAEEIVQDVFLAIWIRRGTWDVPGTIKTYLYRAVLNRIANYRRDRKRSARFLDRFFREVPTQCVGGVEETSDNDVISPLHHALAVAVAELSPRGREVWVLSREHGMTYVEIAVTLGVSVKTVEMHMSRALATLRERLRPLRDTLR
jgi:RNA polymerase sigma-70 factor (ECF subfamily)